MEPAISSDSGMARKTTGRYCYDYPAVAASVAGMTPRSQPGHRLAYDDPATPQQMHADCRAAGDHLRLGAPPRPPSPAAARRSTSTDFPREVAKREIESPRRPHRIANALHLHLD